MTSYPWRFRPFSWPHSNFLCNSFKPPDLFKKLCDVHSSPFVHFLSGITTPCHALWPVAIYTEGLSNLATYNIQPTLQYPLIVHNQGLVPKGRHDLAACTWWAGGLTALLYGESVHFPDLIQFFSSEIGHSNLKIKFEWPLIYGDSVHFRDLFQILFSPKIGHPNLKLIFEWPLIYGDSAYFRDLIQIFRGISSSLQIYLKNYATFTHPHSFIFWLVLLPPVIPRDPLRILWGGKK